MEIYFLSLNQYLNKLANCFLYQDMNRKLKDINAANTLILIRQLNIINTKQNSGCINNHTTGYTGLTNNA